MSVVIPTHNRRELLRRVLEGLARQDYPTGGFEVVVVLDGSADGSREMLQGLSTPYRLRHLCLEGAGVSRARNAGVREALGELVLFLDDDVIPSPGWVSAHARCHEQDDRLVVIGHLTTAPWVSRCGWGRWQAELLERHFTSLGRGEKRLGGGNLYSGNFSVRRRHLLTVGGFDEAMARGEDVDLGYRLEGAGLRFRYSPEADGLHAGHTPYQPWRESYYRQGRQDVVMGWDKGYEGMLDRTLERYHQANPLVRASARLLLDRTAPAALYLAIMRRAAALGDALGLYGLTRFLYSGIAHLRYWQGVSDELGGRGLLMERLRATSGYAAARGYARAGTE